MGVVARHSTRFPSTVFSFFFSSPSWRSQREESLRARVSYGIVCLLVSHLFQFDVSPVCVCFIDHVRRRHARLLTENLDLLHVYPLVWQSRWRRRFPPTLRIPPSVSFPFFLVFCSVYQCFYYFFICYALLLYFNLFIYSSCCWEAWNISSAHSDFASKFWCVFAFLSFCVGRSSCSAKSSSFRFSLLLVRIVNTCVRPPVAIFFHGGDTIKEKTFRVFFSSFFTRYSFFCF